MRRLTAAVAFACALLMPLAGRGADAPRTTATGIPLNAAHTYTLYLAGTPGQLTSIATRDD